MGSPLVYVSFGGGDLWFDWWILEALLSKGFHFASAHFVDWLYTPDAVRDAGLQETPLGSLTAWINAIGISSFAYPDAHQFYKHQPNGASLLVQCDADFQGIDVAKYLSIDGGLLCWLQPEGGDVGVWRRNGP